MALSALDDKGVTPIPEELTRVLGPAEEAWHHLLSRTRTTYGPLAGEWAFSGAKYGWSLRLRRKKRTVFYLIPQRGTFLVGVVLGDRALGVLRRDDLSPETVALIDEAPRYGEGTGFRVPVASVGDCSDVEVVLEAKMA
ncbi:MAG: DUF3788 domain-containing protein [Gemmatimonadota bacterium]|jgi:hypothetical protein